VAVMGQKYLILPEGLKLKNGVGHLVEMSLFGFQSLIMAKSLTMSKEKLISGKKRARPVSRRNFM
jgi:hypothetical protein